MKEYTHGTELTATAQILKISLRPNQDENSDNYGKHLVETVPAIGNGQMDIINPTGRFFLTQKQLEVLADDNGVASWGVLAMAVAQGGDATLGVSAVYCEAGQPYNDAGETYTKDWWKVERFTFAAGANSGAIIVQTATSVIAAEETAQRQEYKNTASTARLAFLAKKSTPNAVDTPAVPVDEPKADAKAKK